MKRNLQKEKGHKGKINVKKIFNHKKVKIFLARGFFIYCCASIAPKVTDSVEAILSNMGNQIDDETEMMKEFSSIMGLEINIDDNCYDILKDSYNQMTQEEKTSFVINVFEAAIDRNNEITLEEKEYLKEYEGEFLQKYGYLYDFENIFDMCNRIEDTDILRSQEFERDFTSGTYNQVKNVIKIESETNHEVLAHEIEHAMNSNSQIPSFIEEAMNSSTDLEYSNYKSYTNEMRSQVLFLGEIIGRDNLINCYLNDDIELLTSLIGQEYLNLFTIFEQEMESIHNNGCITNDLLLQAQEKLKDIYETKFHKKVTDDELIFIIYSSCITESNYHIISTIFYEDEFKYYGPSPKHYLIDGSIVQCDNLEYIMDLSTKQSKINLSNIDFYQSKYDLTLQKLDYLFTLGRAVYLNYDGLIEDNLKNYLKELDVSNIDFWTYNILNNFCSLSLNIEGFPEYTKDSFFEDFSKIYKEKFNYLSSLNCASEILIDLDFILTQKSNNLEFYIDSENLSLFLNKLNPMIDVNKLLMEYYSRKNEEYEFSILQTYQAGTYNEKIKILYAMFGEEEFHRIIESKDIIGYLEKYCKDFCNEEDIPKYINLILNYSLNNQIDYNQEIFINAFYQRLKNNISQEEIITLICDLNEIMGKEKMREVLFKVSNRLINNDNIQTDLILYMGVYWGYKDIYDNHNSILEYYNCTSSEMITLPNIANFYCFQSLTGENIDFIDVKYSENEEFVTYYFNKNSVEDNNIIIMGTGNIEDLKDNNEIALSTNKVKKKVLTENYINNS